MRQRFEVEKKSPSQELEIREYSETDKEFFSLTCLETYPAEVLQTALAKDQDALIESLQTPNFYPVRSTLALIATAIGELYASDAETRAEIAVDDLADLRHESRGREEQEAELPEDVEDADDIDQLLESELDDDMNVEQDEIGEYTPPSPLSPKVAEDDGIELDTDI
jgi:hypothetical protein